MLSCEELLAHPNYLLRTYQLEIFRQLSGYMAVNNLKKQDIAEKLKVSRPYVSQILNGDFNFTLKKLIELGLMMNKIPCLEFVSPEIYWKREKNSLNSKEIIAKTTTYGINTKPSYTPGFWESLPQTSPGGKQFQASLANETPIITNA